jgi:hypothetical protein
MSLRPLTLAFAFCALASAASGFPRAYADETADAIRGALGSYKDGKALEAKQKLDKASALIAAQLAAKLDTFLPGPLDGWTVETDAPGATPSVAPVDSGGLNATRTYVKDELHVTISITGEMPVITAMAVLFADSERAKEAGNRIMQVKGQSAVMTGDGQVQVLVAERFLVIAEGDAAEDVKNAYLDKIDVEGLAKF